MQRKKNKEYKIKDISDLLELSARTIKNWEKKGYIPKPRRNKWGWRVYTEKERELLIATVKKKDYFRK